ncbi:MAG: anthranilate phosphoribosyltransferase [Candidatus Sulfopaludibacter sp.]|nr:anthranilate phosphoribosyltransferase [Candidatus Sulfopaludibacter sp.]
MSLLPYLERVSQRQNLSAEDAREAMRSILGGSASQSQIAGFLMALRTKGETVEELVGFARAMREMAEPVDAGLNGGTILDTCGTGGDGAGTFNISTVAAFVVAGAGVHVAKHGNRAVTSARGCGSADLLESLGIDTAFSPAQAARAIREVGIGFLLAPAVHTAMRHAQPVRLDLKVRTVFNLLGPLTNPAGATSQLAGAPSDHAAELIAGALAALGLERGFVVHGSDGLDEITTTGPTLAFEIRKGQVERRMLEPSDFAVRRAERGELEGGGGERNCQIARAVLAGEHGPARDIVLVNSAAALVAAGKVETFLEGMAIGTVSIDSGAAQAKVEELARFTRK